MKILWGANNYWGSPFQVGANAMARELAIMGNDVAFVSDPISPLHLLAPGGITQLKDRWSIWRSGGGYDLDGRLFYYSPFTTAAPTNRFILRSGMVLDHWHRFTTPNVIHRIERAGFGQVDLLIVDTVAQHFWLDAIPYRRSIVRITDYFAGFQKATTAMLARERDMIRRADAVVYTARNLRAVVESAGARRAAYTPNGIDVDRLIQGDRSEPDEYATIPRPRAIYVGALDEWFDTTLIRECAQAYPNVSFIIIGPERVDLSCLDAFSNIYRLGPRPHRAISQYLWNADVGLIPFRTNHPVVRSVHPIKLYEYIACELPVVSMHWEELDHIDLDFWRAENSDAFASAVGMALSSGKRQQALAQFSWQRTANRLIEIAFA